MSSCEPIVYLFIFNVYIIIINARTSRVFLVLGCEGEAETAWQRPYMGEIAHYKVALFCRGCLAWGGKPAAEKPWCGLVNDVSRRGPVSLVDNVSRVQPMWGGIEHCQVTLAWNTLRGVCLWRGGKPAAQVP